MDKATGIATTVVEEKFSWDFLAKHFPIEHIENAITQIHDSSGLSWAASIIGLTFAFRVLVFPLNVSLVRNSRRLAAIDPEIQKLNAQMQLAPDASERSAAAQKIISLFKQSKCHPMKNLLSPVFFAPMFLTIFAAVHSLCDPSLVHLHPGMTDGGWAWFKDLSAPDSTLVLPSLSAFTWLISIEMGLRGVPGWDDKPSVTQSVLRSLPAVFLPVTFHLPAGVFLYWLTSNLFAIFRTTLLQFRSVRRLLRVPDLRKSETSSINANGCTDAASASHP
jgi:YidC/Oxa1 family membrane protein insertase